MSSTVKIRRHNMTVLASLEEGDMVEFPRGMYSHYAIYSGRGNVIHLSGDNDGIGDSLNRSAAPAYVKEDDFFHVTMSSKAKQSNKDHKYSPIGHGKEIVRRAREKLGEIGYSLLWKNCEHFAAWCRYDKSWSEQVDKALTVGAIGAIAAGVVVFVGTAIGISTRRSKSNKRKLDCVSDMK